MLNTTFARIDEADVPRMRQWLESLHARREELQASYERQGTRHELFFLVRTDDSVVLVLISELADLEQGTESFLRSDFPLDVEFKILVQSLTWFDEGVELLYDSSKFVDSSRL